MVETFSCFIAYPRPSKLRTNEIPRDFMALEVIY